MADVKLKMRISGPALAKTAAVISNGVMLAANVYLMGANISQSVHAKKQARVSDTLQTAVEVTQSLSGLTKIITEIVGKHYVQNSQDL